MNRRDLFRSALIAGGGAAASMPVALAREFASGHDAWKELARADWKPVFLDEHQSETLAAFADILIPATDTPGAKAALSHRFVDRLLAAETRDTQRAFLESLAFLDGLGFELYRNAFRHLDEAHQTSVVSSIAWPRTEPPRDGTALPDFPGHRHFRNLKDWVSRAYYASEAGQRALGYDGPPHGQFSGCEHTGGHT